MAIDAAMNNSVCRRISAAARRFDQIFREGRGLAVAVLEGVHEQANAERVDFQRGNLVEPSQREQHAEAESGKKLALELGGILKRKAHDSEQLVRHLRRLSSQRLQIGHG